MRNKKSIFLFITVRNKFYANGKQITMHNKMEIITILIFVIISKIYLLLYYYIYNICFMTRFNTQVIKYILFCGCFML